MSGATLELGAAPDEWTNNCNCVVRRDNALDRLELGVARGINAWLMWHDLHPWRLRAWQRGRPDQELQLLAEGRLGGWRDRVPSSVLAVHAMQVCIRLVALARLLVVLELHVAES